MRINDDVSYVLENYEHFIVFMEQEDYIIKLKHLIGLDYLPDDEDVVNLVQEFLDKMGLEDEDIRNTKLVVLDSVSMKSLYEHFQYGNKITIQ